LAPTAADRDAGLSALYQERILAHYRTPHHKGTLERATGVHTVKNPLCGDDVTVAVRAVDGVVREAAFTGTGCSITQASASMLMDLVRGRSRVEIEALWQAFDAMLAGHDADSSLGEMQALRGVAGFKARHKCARLPWQALLGALDRTR
jgi:nitrogen fixation NifU-like protein